MTGPSGRLSDQRKLAQIEAQMFALGEQLPHCQLFASWIADTTNNKGASRRPRSFNSFPLHHQQVSQARVVKGIFDDRHGPLPSLVPSSDKSFVWCGRWRDLQGDDSGNTIVNHLLGQRRQAQRSSSYPHFTETFEIACPPLLNP